MFVIFFMLISGFFVFCSMRKYLLMTLIGLEFLMMSLYMMLFNFLSVYSFSLFFMLVFLVFTVCEAVMGLSILVSLIRSHGNDTVSSLSVLGW